MSKSKYLTLNTLAIVLSVAACLLSLLALTGAKQSANMEHEKLGDLLIDRVRACVDYNKDIRDKAAIYTLLDGLQREKLVVQQGSDDFRVKFVHSQGCFEHVIACSQVLGEIVQMVGVIHTPTPATPLCTHVDDAAMEQLLDPSIVHDLDKLLTVRSRAQIVREYLEKGGTLFVAYPRGGLEKRTLEQRQIYQTALERYPLQLFDAMLDCTEMDANMVGATYLFRSNDQRIYAFSIKARQAIDPQELSEWGLWFGEITHPVVQKRVNLIMDYLAHHKGPDLRREFL